MAWDSVTYDRTAVHSPKIDRFLDAIRKSHVNGGVIVACFEPDDPAEFDDSARRDLHGVDRCISSFLTRPSVRVAVPELQLPAALDPPPKFGYKGPFELEGQLTQTLLVGGAYRQFDGTVQEARQISRDFVEELVADRWLNVAVVAIGLLTEWFYDVAWDAFLIVFDQQGRRFWLICITDTD
jgi:hypothetical protein